MKSASTGCRSASPSSPPALRWTRETRKSCGVCGLDYSFADAGDGPAVFVILIIGFIVVGLALWLEVNYSPALWVHLILWIPLSTILCLGLLRGLKGLMIALQYRHKAAEGQIDRG